MESHGDDDDGVMKKTEIQAISEEESWKLEYLEDEDFRGFRD